MKNLDNLELTEIQHNENYLLVINYPDTIIPDVIAGTGKELIDFIFENEEFDDDELDLPEIEKLEIIVDKHQDDEWLPQLNLFKIK
jgi:hypothetical protein